MLQWWDDDDDDLVVLFYSQEYDLEQKIDVEIRIREGTTKLLAACQHPSQALEAAKTLHTSNERMNVYMTELQSRKRDLLSRPPPASIITATTSSRSRYVCDIFSFSKIISLLHTHVHCAVLYTLAKKGRNQLRKEGKLCPIVIF